MEIPEVCIDTWIFVFALNNETWTSEDVKHTSPKSAGCHYIKFHSDIIYYFSLSFWWDPLPAWSTPLSQTRKLTSQKNPIATDPRELESCGRHRSVWLSKLQCLHHCRQPYLMEKASINVIDPSLIPAYPSLSPQTSDTMSATHGGWEVYREFIQASSNLVF